MEFFSIVFVDKRGFHCGEGLPWNRTDIMNTKDSDASHREFIALYSASHRRIFGFVVSISPCYADVDEIFQSVSPVLWAEMAGICRSSSPMEWTRHERVDVPSWLQKDFDETDWKVGMDEGERPGRPEDPRILGTGAGRSVDYRFSVWKRKTPSVGKVVLGGLPSIDTVQSMYGILAIPVLDNPGSHNEAIGPLSSLANESSRLVLCEVSGFLLM
jgi:hypothetical protein